MVAGTLPAEAAMALPPDLRVTTEILWKAAGIFAPVDAVWLAILARRVDARAFRSVKLPLLATTGIFWCGVWLVLTAGAYWEAVYSYVFPAWARWLIAPGYGLLFVAVAWLFWTLALRLPGSAVVNYCLLGGLWGALTHLAAIGRGLLDKPPMLRGASPIAAVVFPIFEFILYWCITLTLAMLVRRLSRARGRGRA